MPTLAEIAALLNVPVRPADANRGISGVSSLEDAGSTDISYLSSDAYLPQFQQTQAAAVIVDKRVKLREPNAKTVTLVVENAEFAPMIPRPPRGIDTAARVAGDAQIAADAAIGAFAKIGARTRIASRSIIHSGVFIGDDVAIGQDSEIFPNVVIRERITIGDRVIIHAGSVLGSDGFGYRWNGSKHVKIPQIGTVVIEDDVEIGSCVCVDRAKMGETRIGRGTKIDNLVQVAHNCVIGPHCIIAGQAGMAGSAVLGAGVVLGGQTAVRDHITMGDTAIGAACSGIAEDVEPGMIVSGTPALPHRQSLREQKALRRLPDLIAHVRKLQEEIEQLKRQRS
jgi:UDP-3-O-[3-hydroxymyristoyl] glucosamine N-acyltransferase